MSFEPGEYHVEAAGQNGSFPMTVVFSKERIEVINIDTSSETKAIASPVFDRLPKQIIAGQTLAVDVISGATVSSVGVIDGVKTAIQLAGGDVSQFLQLSHASKASCSPSLPKSIDVLVVGSGGAGLSAAIEVAEAGRSVAVIEQMAIIGGNTNRATGGMNGAYTRYQQALGIEDSIEQFYTDTMQGGHGLNDPDLVRSLVAHSSDAIDWLNNLGGDLTDVNISGGATQPRFHRSPDGSPVGPLIIELLTKRLNQLDVPVYTDHKVDGLKSTESGYTVTVYPSGRQPVQIQAKAVIVATGGFGANAAMLIEQDPTLDGFETTNHPGADGRGIYLAQQLGAAVVDMDQIQIHPTTQPGTGYLFTEGLRGDGAVLINQEGQRFINELATRDVVAQAILKQTQQQAYLLFTQELVNSNHATQNYVQQGYTQQGDTLQELAVKLNVPGDVLRDTLALYEEAHNGTRTDSFGRQSMKLSFMHGPYYALAVTPSVHHTMGGLRIDPLTHVLRADGRVLPHLYAAGEVTGGVHGGNRIGGNAVLDIIVHGRIAGQRAANELEQ